MTLFLFVRFLDEIVNERERIHTKPPQWMGLYDFLEDRAEEWAKLAMLADLPQEFIKKYQNRYSFKPRPKLARALKCWVEMQSTPMTWEYFISFLKRCNYKEASVVEDWLKQQRRKDRL